MDNKSIIRNRVLKYKDVKEHYLRTKFIPKWFSRAWARTKVLASRKKVGSGPKRTFTDEFTGKTIKKLKEINFDHVVPLGGYGGAWGSGAYKWSDEKRRSFAIDPENLNITTRKVNIKKGTKGPGKFVPPKEKEFVEKYESGKVKWGLSVPPDQASAIKKILGRKTRAIVAPDVSKTEYCMRCHRQMPYKHKH